MGNELLSSKALVERVRTDTNLEDFGEETWQEPLERLLDSLLGEARLSEIGMFVAAEILAGHLRSRLWVTDWHTRHPEIGQAPVSAPLFVLGQPRTGTTILFDLLGQDPRLRMPLTWEVSSPHPPPQTASYLTDPRIAESQAGIDMSEVMNPGFQAIHPSGAQRGQECVAITAGDFRSMLFGTVCRVPTYMNWLLREADMAPAYRYHRRFLQVLQWRHPADRWLLKSPAHLWCLPALFREYPAATIINTHRDPLRVLASTASLTEHLQRMTSGTTTIPEMAEEWVEHLTLGNDASVTAREDATVPAGQAVDFVYQDLVRDPFAALAQLYERLEVPFTAVVEQRMRDFLKANASDKHGVHRYTFSATGLDEQAVRARTKRYEDYFQVPQEPLD